ncbi:AAA family ATPase [Apibacter raozihei]|uniref:AAA family ATPase n=1 Tax=Apibacter raozihei TaxID=2500547 RepID=UPI000FE2AA45|nr:AAA family ATPase [Apibacter raozihei]
MQIKEFYIEGLFDLYNHKIDFTINKHERANADVIMIYGKNGIGKTTVLRMVDGFMTLDFDEFRKSKFKYAHLIFSNSNRITVKKVVLEEQKYLFVTYRSGNKKILNAKLNVDDKFEDTPENILSKQNFTEQYRKDLDKFSYEFIDTERLIKKNIKDESISEKIKLNKEIIKKIKFQNKSFLNNKIRNFIKDSQINYSNYFHTEEPDLFDKILDNIDNVIELDYKKILERLNLLEKIEKQYKFNQLKLYRENWDYKKLKNKIETFKNNQIKLSIISAYINVHESRIFELVSLANRLLVFENTLNDYLSDKKITISGNGFKINILNSMLDEISENELSTGEYHLLYLTVLALCTKVKGSVIAIDEPEMSMHISWQRKLVNSLITIASNASPQMIFATHSPDIAENFPNSLITERYE